MSTIRNLTSKATVQGGLALLFAGTTCVLGVRGDIDGPSFLGLMLLVAGFYFGKGGGTDK